MRRSKAMIEFEKEVGPVQYKRIMAAVHWEVELSEFEKMTKRQWALWKGWMKKSPLNRKELLDLVALMNAVNQPLQDMLKAGRVH